MFLLIVTDKRLDSLVRNLLEYQLLQIKHWKCTLYIA